MLDLGIGFSQDLAYWHYIPPMYMKLNTLVARSRGFLSRSHLHSRELSSSLVRRIVRAAILQGSEEMTQPPGCTSGDLTFTEIKEILRTFFLSSFGFLLIVGVPYALLTGLFWGAETVTSEEQYSWLVRALSWVVIATMLAFVAKNIPYTLKYFGDFLLNLSTIAAKVSLGKQLVGAAFILGYFYSLYKFPMAWFVFTIAVLIPAGHAYDQYLTILKRKDEKTG